MPSKMAIPISISLMGTASSRAMSGDACTVDGKHPNDLGFHRMASVIGSVIGTLL